MRILVTGGAGFISSHIAAAYLQEGHQVSVVDNLSQGKRENIPLGATFYPMDILDPQLDEVFSREKPEVINHHAAQIDVRKSVMDPAFDARVNIMGTLNLLDSAVQHGTHQVILASSGGTVYGENGVFPLSEQSPLEPKSPYGLSKYVGERYLQLYFTLFGLNSVILRYSNVYGPRQDPKGEAGVVAIFCENILNEKPLTVFGDGTQTRDYVFVSDVVAANLEALRMKECLILNVGTSQETSVNELISAFERLAGRPLLRNHAPPRQGELQRNSLSSSWAREKLGWSPKVSLEEGLRQTLNWFQGRTRGAE